MIKPNGTNRGVVLLLKFICKFGENHRQMICSMIQIYSMVLDQLLNQHSALVEMVTICQTVNTSESVQFEKAVRIFTEKLSGLLEFLGVVKNVIDSCLGRDLKVDMSTQTEEGGPSSSGDASHSVYSSVSGRKIRQTERFQGFLELENSTTVGPRSEFKSHSRKRRRNVKSGSTDVCILKYIYFLNFQYVCLCVTWRIIVI